jgi:large subunit ribosomal protein L21
MFAVIKTGGKQYIVQEGEVITIEKLAADAGATVSFDTLLMADEEGNQVNLGTPALSSKVTGEVVTHGKAKKIEVVKYKAKSKYHRRTGHRQHFTKVKITKLA